MLRPIENLDFPDVPLGTVDPISMIAAAREFKAAREYFETYPPNSLLYNGGIARAFIYLLIRSMQLRRVLEIGTYQAGTTEVIARALRANGGGHVDTVDPSGGPFIEDVIKGWDNDLSALCNFHLMNSMQYFGKAVRERAVYDLVFVDGDHDFEAALFDIQRASNVLAPNGFVLLDNADQPGVREAGRCFLADHPEWNLLGEQPAEMRKQSSIVLLTEGIMSVKETGFWCLRSPGFISLTDRLTSFANVPFAGEEIHGLEMKTAPGSSSPLAGRLRYKTYLRALPINYSSGLNPLEYETVGEIPLASAKRQGDSILLPFARPLVQLRGLSRIAEYSKFVEIFLTYSADPGASASFSIVGRPAPLTEPA